jgi:hypothetical protein
MTFLFRIFFRIIQVASDSLVSAIGVPVLFVLFRNFQIESLRLFLRGAL